RSSLSILRPPHTSKLFPYTTLFRSLLKSLEGHHNRPGWTLSNPEPFPFSVPSPVCAVSRGRCGLAKAGFVGGLHVGLFTGDLLFAQVLLDYIVHELHPLVLPALDDVPNVGRLALAD